MIINAAIVGLARRPQAVGRGIGNLDVPFVRDQPGHPEGLTSAPWTSYVCASAHSSCAAALNATSKTSFAFISIN